MQDYFDELDDYLDGDVEETLEQKSSDASISRLRNERYKRKTARRILEYYPYMNYHFGSNARDRYALWQAMKDTRWKRRRYGRGGWNDQAFRKKLWNSRARHTKVIANGNHYRKIQRRPHDARIKFDEEEADELWD